jgi:hypothetical protein
MDGASALQAQDLGKYLSTPKRDFDGLVELYTQHYAFGLILILLCQYSLDAWFIATYVSNHIITTTPAIRVRYIYAPFNERRTWKQYIV